MRHAGPHQPGAFSFRKVNKTPPNYHPAITEFFKKNVASLFTIIKKND